MKQNPWRWVGWTACVLLLIVIGLLWGRFTRIEDAGHWRIIFSVVSWFAMLGTVFLFPHLSRRRALLLLVFAAVVVRLSYWGAPVSNDVNRYLWEGSLLWKGENPYAAKANEAVWEHLRDDYWEGMNTRDRMTAYPPGMELVMAAASRIWYHLHVFKVVALIGDLWILALLVILSREYARPVRWLGFYAFNPIVIASFAVEAHFDSLMVAPMLTALMLASRARWRGAWFWLGFAVQMKIMALLLVPLLILAQHRKATRRLLWQPRQHLGPYVKMISQSVWPFLLVLILPSLVFWKHLWGMIYGFLAFGSQGAFNGGFYELLRFAAVPEILARLIGTFLFGAGVAWILWAVLMRREKDLLRASFRIFLLLLIFSPVVHFWYLTWVVWFLVVRPSASLLALCLTMSVYYLSWIYSELGFPWGYPREVSIGIWVPFFALLFWELRHFRKRSRQHRFPPVQTVSVVIPVYQEGPKLAQFLEKLQAASEGVGEYIVVDGAGELSEEGEIFGPEIRVLQSERGRGRQIARGTREATGDLVVIVHADTEPRVGWVEEIRQAANQMHAAPAFALGQRFSDRSLGLLIVEFLNEQRVLFGGAVFGDQTIIIRQKALQQIGGFPEQPLMEDVEVSARLLELGPIEYLGKEWVVSARKWEGRFRTRFRVVVGLMIRYHFVRTRSRQKAADLSNRLFDEYYGVRQAPAEEDRSVGQS